MSRDAELAEEVYQEEPPNHRKMGEHEERLEGLRYRVERLRDELPPHRVSEMMGRIDGRERALQVADWSWDEAQQVMEMRINEIEEDIEKLEDWAGVNNE